MIINKMTILSPFAKTVPCALSTALPCPVRGVVQGFIVSTQGEDVAAAKPLYRNAVHSFSNQKGRPTDTLSQYVANEQQKKPCQCLATFD